MQSTKAEDLQRQIDSMQGHIKSMEKVLLNLANRIYQMREIFDAQKLASEEK